jgi:hypothetical protein
MNTIIIEGPEQATMAAVWAETNVTNKWSINNVNGPFSNNYAFIFSDSTDATHFALKWR